jgi:hypothetical protein
MPKTKFPVTLGACVDLCYQIRASRLEVEKKVEELKTEQHELEDYILKKFDKAEIDSARGNICTAAVTRNTVPRVLDWDKFIPFVLKEKDLSLLERRPSRAACRERWEAGEVIPGVEPFVVVGLSLTKVGGKE